MQPRPLTSGFSLVSRNTGGNNRAEPKIKPSIVPPTIEFIGKYTTVQICFELLAAVFAAEE